jgi:hypothetical protein
MADDPDLAWIIDRLARSAVTERAPAQLRRAIAATDPTDPTEPTDPTLQRLRLRRSGPVAGLLGAVGLLAGLAIVLALVLERGGTPDGPTVDQAAAVGAQPISYSPPPSRASTARQVMAYARFADSRIPRGLDIWDFEGWRIARLDGRRILTIYYAHGDDEISYSVAARPRLSDQRAGFTSFHLDGRTVISWSLAGRSCVLSSAALSRAMLLAIAHS